jgi:hypothetical protein
MPSDACSGLALRAGSRLDELEITGVIHDDPLGIILRDRFMLPGYALSKVAEIVRRTERRSLSHAGGWGEVSRDRQ